MTHAELAMALQRLCEAEDDEEREVIAERLVDSLIDELEERIPTAPLGVARSCARALVARIRHTAAQAMRVGRLN